MKKDTLLASFKRPDSSANSLPKGVADIKLASTAVSVPDSRPEAIVSIPSTPTNRESTIGRYLSYDDDKKALLELRIYLSSQGIKVNDSKLIRAIICTIKPGEELVRNYISRQNDDKRFKKVSK